MMGRYPALGPLRRPGPADRDAVARRARAGRHARPGADARSARCPVASGGASFLARAIAAEPDAVPARRAGDRRRRHDPGGPHGRSSTPRRERAGRSIATTHDLACGAPALRARRRRSTGRSSRRRPGQSLVLDRERARADVRRPPARPRDRGGHARRRAPPRPASAAASATSTTTAGADRCSTRSSTRSRYGFFLRALRRVGRRRPRVRGRRQLHGPARPGVHGRRAQPRRIPGRRRRVPAQGPVLPRRRASRRSGTALAIGWVTRRGGLRGDTAIGVLFAGMFALGIFLFSRSRTTSATCSASCSARSWASAPSDLRRPGRARGRRPGGRRRCSGRSSSTRPSTRSARPPPACRSVALDYLFLALHRADDRGQPAGGGDHPGRRDAGDAGGHGAAAHAPVRPADGGRRRHRRGRPIVGLYLSYWLNSASGATIVLVETAVFLVALLLGPRAGLFRARPAMTERAG